MSSEQKPSNLGLFRNSRALTRGMVAFVLMQWENKHSHI